MVPASLIVTTALFSGGCATMQDITPQIENEMRQGIQMKSPGIPHKEALSCLAQIFNERFPNDRLVVTKMKESSGKFSEDFGFYLPQDPHIMLETILTNAGFRVSSRDTNFRTSLTERQGMQKGLIKPVYNQKFSPVTIGLTGAVTGLEFAVQSEAAKAGIGPVGVRYEQSRGKLSVDIKAVDLETGSNLWAASSSVSFRSREGGPSYHDFGILGLDDDYFLIGLQGGQTPSLSDLARAGMAKAVYETLAPFIQEKRGLCDRCIEKQDLSSAQIESAHSASSANTSSKSPSMDR
jgi:curli biogenesis system outer membrane secretion channel CsgG